MRWRKVLSAYALSMICEIWIRSLSLSHSRIFISSCILPWPRPLTQWTFRVSRFAYQLVKQHTVLRYYIHWLCPLGIFPLYKRCQLSYSQEMVWRTLTTLWNAPRNAGLWLAFILILCALRLVSRFSNIIQIEVIVNAHTLQRSECTHLDLRGLFCLFTSIGYVKFATHKYQPMKNERASNDSRFLNETKQQKSHLFFMNASKKETKKKISGDKSTQTVFFLYSIQCPLPSPFQRHRYILAISWFHYFLYSNVIAWTHASLNLLIGALNGKKFENSGKCWNEVA